MVNVFKQIDVQTAVRFSVANGKLIPEYQTNVKEMRRINMQH